MAAVDSFWSDIDQTGSSTITPSGRITVIMSAPSGFTSLRSVPQTGVSSSNDLVFL